MKLSVIIPTYDGEARVGETIRSITESCPRQEALEIIVVDDGSPVPIRLPDLGVWAGEARLVRLNENGGRARACNAGIAAARAPVVVILDDDMSVATGTLEGHLAAHEEAASKLAIVGRIEASGGHFRGRFGAFLMRQEEERHKRLRARASKLRFEDCLTGHFSALRQTLQCVGGYSESFSRYGFEDIELAWRLREAGVSLVYDENLVTTHRSDHASFGKACRRQVDTGVMARVFADESDAREVDLFLRIGGMPRERGDSRFRRLMSMTHTFTRRTPSLLRPALLTISRLIARASSVCLSDRLLHAVYLLVLDMHYAAGIASTERRKT